MKKRLHDWMVDYKRLMVIIVVETVWFVAMTTLVLPWTQRI